MGNQTTTMASTKTTAIPQAKSCSVRTVGGSCTIDWLRGVVVVSGCGWVMVSGAGAVVLDWGVVVAETTDAEIGCIIH